MSTTNPLIVEVEYNLGGEYVKQRVDVVAFYLGLPPEQTARYQRDAKAAAVELFWDESYELPMAYLSGWLLERVEMRMPRGPGIEDSHISDDAEISSVEVVERSGQRPDRGQGDWQQADLDVLVGLVPWMSLPALPSDDRAPLPGQLAIDGAVIA